MAGIGNVGSAKLSAAQSILPIVRDPRNSSSATSGGPGFLTTGPK